MNWTLLVAKAARRSLAKFPAKDQARVEAAMDRMAADPFSGDIRRLEPCGWRRRVGNYRIFFDIDMDLHLIQVTAISRRTSSTY